MHNSSSQLANGIVDLHGLHVAEMIECVESIIEKCFSEKRSSVRFITGSGHHTKGPQKSISRLKPALEGFFRDKKMRFTEILDCNGYTSGLCVYL
jgi:DNA-nicking Smr family endonuclease